SEERRVGKECRSPGSAHTSIKNNLKHNKVLHEHNVILTIKTADTPRVREEDRVQLTPVTPLFTRVILRFGFMESPNVPKALALARKRGLHFDIMSTSFFLSRRALRPQAHSGIPRWQDRLFFFLAEDGIRDRNVTGVQTCALPIWEFPADKNHLVFSRPLDFIQTDHVGIRQRKSFDELEPVRMRLNKAVQLRHLV